MKTVEKSAVVRNGNSPSFNRSSDQFPTSLLDIFFSRVRCVRSKLNQIINSCKDSKYRLNFVLFCLGLYLPTVEAVNLPSTKARKLVNI